VTGGAVQMRLWDVCAALVTRIEGPLHPYDNHTRHETDFDDIDSTDLVLTAGI
jgi:hypothetical protein